MKRDGGQWAGSSKFGFVEWFRPGEYERTEAIVPEIVASGASYIRTHLSWAEFHVPGGPEWYDWLFPKLSEHLDVLPCIHYTPPSLSRTGRSSGAPRRLRDYADFVDQALTRYGEHFRDVELWNEPNNLLDWDWREDVDFGLFCEMIGEAAIWADGRGWRPILGGPAPFDPYWLNLMGERGILSMLHAVGFHGFPGTWDSEFGSWGGWDLHIGEMRRIIEHYNPDAQIWITETGYSTWRNDEYEQVRRFMQALKVPADRMYWYSWRDVPHDVAVQEGFWFDARHYHLGAVAANGQPKLLARLLHEGGLEKVEQLDSLGAPNLTRGTRPILITGGSGFIGCNLAESLLADGEEVVILDNLSRPGVDCNLTWLTDKFGDRVHPFLSDIRDLPSIENAFVDAKAVFHLAAQTAVTSSLIDPVNDHDVNTRGTLNVLEAVRAAGADAPVIFASTNKVYGALADLEMIEFADRYMPANPEITSRGIDESRPLNLCTPYGCSKGAADQYVLDYAKSFGVPTAVLRMSCVYGPRQFGTEDQGWVAHFLISALEGRPITIYGDGKQVRDMLHVSDAVSAYRDMLASIDKVKGQAFNLGGGPANAASLLVVLQRIGELLGCAIEPEMADWRQGDQPYFVADTRALQHVIGWRPRVDWRAGIADLAEWLSRTRNIPIPITTKRRASA